MEAVMTIDWWASGKGRAIIFAASAMVAVTLDYVILSSFSVI